MGIIPPSQYPDPKDPWDTLVTGYDADKFYTRATNSHDHAVELSRIRVTRNLMAAATLMIDRIPRYNSINDLVRDALIHRLHYLNELQPDHPIFVPLDQEVLLALLDQDRQDQEAWEQEIKELDEIVGRWIRRGDLVRAERALDLATDVPEHMTPSYAEEMSEIIRRHRDMIARSRRYGDAGG